MVNRWRYWVLDTFSRQKRNDTYKCFDLPGWVSCVFFYLLKVGTVRNCNQNLGNSFIKSACTNHDGINDFQIRKLGLYLSLCMFLFVYLFAWCRVYVEIARGGRWQELRDGGVASDPKTAYTVLYTDMAEPIVSSDNFAVNSKNLITCFGLISYNSQHVTAAWI